MTDKNIHDLNEYQKQQQEREYELELITDDEKLMDFYTDIMHDTDRRSALADCVDDNEEEFIRFMAESFSCKDYKSAVEMQVQDIVHLANASLRFIRKINKTVIDSYITEDRVIELLEMKQNER